MSVPIIWELIVRQGFTPDQGGEAEYSPRSEEFSTLQGEGPEYSPRSDELSPAQGGHQDYSPMSEEFSPVQGEGTETLVLEYSPRLKKEGDQTGASG